MTRAHQHERWDLLDWETLRSHLPTEGQLVGAHPKELSYFLDREVLRTSCREAGGQGDGSRSLVSKTWWVGFKHRPPGPRIQEVSWQDEDLVLGSIGGVSRSVESHESR